MPAKLRLMTVLAHPDDESLGTGGSLSTYHAEGVETIVVCATRGERGRYFANDNRPSDDEVGRAREQELRAACRELGVTHLELLGYLDRELDQADPAEAVAKIARLYRHYRPQVVITFGSDGAYGHTDHVAIGQFALAAAIEAAREDYRGQDTIRMTEPPHAVSKFYFMAWTHLQWEAYQSAFRKLTFLVDDIERQAAPFPDWQITTEIDATARWEQVWRAVRCHQTQLTIYGPLEDLTVEQQKTLWGIQQYIRVYSLVNGGRVPEIDLFAGLR